ncbi:hypothetical protein Tco_0093126 [Tanacetum coccineum]
MIVMMMKTMMMMKALQLDQTRVGQQRKEDLILPLLGQLNLLQKMMTKTNMNKKLCNADLEGPSFNLLNLHKNSVFLQYQMDECHKLLTNKVDLSNPEGHQIPQNINEPLPLGGPPGQVTIQPQFFFNKDLDYLLTGDKERKIALSNIQAQKPPSCYLDIGLEELVPYDVGLRVKPNMTSVRSMASLTGGDRRKEFFNINNPLLGIESYQTKINLELPNWDAADYYFKEDYTIVPKPRAVVYRDRNNQRKLMRLNELHKFSDGTLTRVMEKLDQMVKDFHLYEYNKGMETRKWSEDDKR